MPSAPIRLLIILTWMGTTTWLAYTELWPLYRAEPEGYARVIGRVEQARYSEWDLTLNHTSRVGKAETEIVPADDGSVTLKGSFAMKPTSLPQYQEIQDQESSEGDRLYEMITMSSEIRVSKAQKLDSLIMKLNLPGSLQEISIVGHVEEGNLVLKPSGVPLLPEELRIPLEDNSMILDRATPVDRLPNLYPGRSWVTRSVNPLAVASGPIGWLFGGQSLIYVEHEVIDSELIVVDGLSWLCHVVRHRSGDNETRTWARVNDGLVVQREVRFADLCLTLSRVAIPEESVE